jgi:hypothetical protein
LTISRLPAVYHATPPADSSLPKCPDASFLKLPGLSISAPLLLAGDCKHQPGVSTSPTGLNSSLLFMQLRLLNIVRLFSVSLPLSFRSYAYLGRQSGGYLMIDENRPLTRPRHIDIQRWGFNNALQRNHLYALSCRCKQVRWAYIFVTFVILCGTMPSKFISCGSFCCKRTIRFALRRQMLLSSVHLARCRITTAVLDYTRTDLFYAIQEFPRSSTVLKHKTL